MSVIEEMEWDFMNSVEPYAPKVPSIVEHIKRHYILQGLQFQSWYGILIHKSAYVTRQNTSLEFKTNCEAYYVTQLLVATEKQLALYLTAAPFAIDITSIYQFFLCNNFYSLVISNTYVCLVNSNKEDITCEQLGIDVCMLKQG